jgi:cytidylate kinase
MKQMNDFVKKKKSASVIIAIDGPTGSGKGTVAELLSKKLNILHLDTGAIYRAITVFFLSGGTDLKDADIVYDKEKIYLNRTDITERIRDNEISINVAKFAVRKDVQDKVRSVQYAVARNISLVAEGRETTSVAFPDADYKFYLNADIAERARRRFLQLSGVTYEAVYEQIKERDRLDMTREVSPLIKVADAIEIDATYKTPMEVVDEMISYMT